VLLAQANSFSAFEQVLNDNFKTFKKYSSKWHLTLNPIKSIANVFHLNNKEACSKLDIKIENITIVNEEYPC